MVMPFGVGTVLDQASRPMSRPARSIAATPQARTPVHGLSAEELGPAALLAILPAIEALQADAIEANAFASTDFLAAAVRHLPATSAPRALAVWRAGEAGKSRRLAGLFPLSQHAQWGTAAILRGWTHPFVPLGTPLVDRADAPAILETALRHLRGAHPAQAALCLNQINRDGDLGAALRLACDKLGLPVEVLAEQQRAAITRPQQAEEPQRRSKERRRQQRRLSERGALGFALAESYNDVRAALETFLSLEARGWKGRNGSALVQAPAYANFTRSMLWSAARAGRAGIALLTLDSETIAAGILIWQGNRAFFWKIAYAEEYAAFSPGALLALEMADAMRRDGRFEMVDSCAIPGHRMIESVWHGRVTVADVLIGLSPGEAAAYRAALGRERMRRDLRERLKRIYTRLRGNG